MSVKHKKYASGCEDCGFYHDCPMDYECPALECLNNLREQDCIIMVRNGIFYAMIEKESIKEDEEE